TISRYNVLLFFCRRMKLKALAEEKKKVSESTKHESIECQESVKLLADWMDLKISIEDTQCSKPVLINKGFVDTDSIQQHEPEGKHISVQECEDDNSLVIETTGFVDTDSIQQHEPENCKNMDINTAITAGTMTTGIGYAQMEEMFAAANVPCMSEKTYIQHREIVLDEFEKTAIESMKMAGQLEKQLSLERNEVINNRAYITVVADGSWAKRSYGTAYDSLSGVGAIIGYRTRKVLFVGIRSKFCTICHMAEQKGIQPRSHKCYRNFDRNVSSTRMESDAIAEGFTNSIDMHGLIFRTLIADGDSNVYQSIINNNPYHEYKITVRKVECTNHLLRNLCKKLKTVSETTEPKFRRNRNFIKLRNIVKNNIFKIRNDILQLSEYRREEKQPQHCLATKLREDVINVPSHIFGEHKRCKEHGRICENTTNSNEENYVPHLKSYGQYPKIQNAIIYLSVYADSLLLKVTNNLAESFHSVVCAEIGGKRVFYGARGSYNTRIAAAVIQHNTQQVLTEFHKNVCTSVPSITENLEKRRQKKTHSLFVTTNV
ncbi:hypothetical protein ALC62_16002, partial [Cyphomyrmex costatus]